ncbi:hypothetical protein N0V90_011200 [Kalmusia sp. IMI 367209]|nr:hypothetical protein N0V90_011200 [Kalmusia sp. IMI 367209]
MVSATILTLSAAKASLAGVRASLKRSEPALAGCQRALLRLKKVASGLPGKKKGHAEETAALDLQVAGIQRDEALQQRDAALLQVVAGSRELHEARQQVLAAAEHLEKTVEQYADEVACRKAQLDATRAEFEALKAKVKIVDALKRQLNTCNKKIAAVRSELQSSKSAEQQHQQAALQARMQVVYVQQQTAQSHQQAAHYMNSCNEAQLAIAGLVNRNHELEAENMSTTKTLEATGDALVKTQHELITARGDASVTVQELSIAKETISTLTAELEAYKKKCATLTTTLDITQIELSAYKNDEAVYADEVIAAIEPVAVSEVAVATRLLTIIAPKAGTGASQISTDECKNIVTDSDSDATIIGSPKFERRAFIPPHLRKKPEYAHLFAPAPKTEKRDVTNECKDIRSESHSSDIEMSVIITDPLISNNKTYDLTSECKDTHSDADISECSDSQKPATDAVSRYLKLGRQYIPPHLRKKPEFAYLFAPAIKVTSTDECKDTLTTSSKEKVAFIDEPISPKDKAHSFISDTLIGTDSEKNITAADSPDAALSSHTFKGVLNHSDSEKSTTIIEPFYPKDEPLTFTDETKDTHAEPHSSRNLAITSIDIPEDKPLFSDTERKDSVIDADMFKTPPIIESKTELSLKPAVTYTDSSHFVVKKPMTVEFKQDENGIWAAVITDPIDPKDLLIEALQNKIAAITAELGARNAQVVRTTTEAASKDMKIIEYKVKIASINLDLAAKEKEILAKDAEILALNDAIAATKEDFASRHTSLANANNTLISKDAEINAKGALLIHTTTALAITKRELSISRTALRTTQAALATTSSQLSATQDANTKLEILHKMYACDKNPSCISCPHHMQRALHIAMAAEVASAQLLSETHMERLKAISELHDYEVHRARSDTLVEHASPLHAAVNDEDESEEQSSDEDDLSEADSDESSVIFIGTDGRMPVDVPSKPEPEPEPESKVEVEVSPEVTSEPVVIVGSKRHVLSARAFIPPHRRRQGFALRSLAQHMPDLVRQ